MDVSPTTILCIEENPVNAGLIRGWLNQAKEFPHEIIWCATFQEGVDKLTQNDFDLILMDLVLPDSRADETFKHLKLMAAQTPVIIISAEDKMEAAIQAIRHGAQDFLLKGHINSVILMRSILFSIERHHAQRILQNQVFRDGPSGLESRSFFLHVSQKELEISRRNRTKHHLIVYRLEEMKDLFSLLGDNVRATLPRGIGKVLNQSFRVSDMITRLSENSYAILAINSGDVGSDVVIRQRLEDKLGDLKQIGHYGMSQFDPDNPKNIMEMMAEAEAELFLMQDLPRSHDSYTDKLHVLKWLLMEAEQP